MAKKKLEQGLTGLLSTPAPTASGEQMAAPEGQQEERNASEYKPICWNLHPNDIENVKRIAKYEGKRANAVVTDALHYYFKHWKPVPQETPTLL